jgi:hypothetical protein
MEVVEGTQTLVATISAMRGDPARTALVISELPHPWALLRDRLAGELVSVAWARPPEVADAVAAMDPGPWVVAGGESSLPAPALEALRGRLFAAHWVREPPSGLPVLPVRHASWRELAQVLEQRLAVRLGGVRLAPGCGLVLPDGSVINRTSPLEGLLAAYPDGLEVAHMDPRLRSALRRAALTLERHHLPLEVVSEDRRVAVVVTGVQPGRRALK